MKSHELPLVTINQVFHQGAAPTTMPPAREQGILHLRPEERARLVALQKKMKQHLDLDQIEWLIRTLALAHLESLHVMMIADANYANSEGLDLIDLWKAMMAKPLKIRREK